MKTKLPKHHVTIANTYRSDPATPMSAIRQKCLDCCAGSAKEVETCTVTTCPLWTRRFGVRRETAHSRGRNVVEN